MNWNNRFPIDPSDLGHTVLDKMEDLKIHIFKCNGKLCGTYELSGSVGDKPFGDGDDDDESDKPAALSLLGELLKVFQRGRE